VASGLASEGGTKGALLAPRSGWWWKLWKTRASERGHDTNRIVPDLTTTTERTGQHLQNLLDLALAQDPRRAGDDCPISEPKYHI